MQELKVISFLWYRRLEIQCYVGESPLKVITGTDTFRCDWPKYPSVYETILLHSSVHIVSRIN